VLVFQELKARIMDDALVVLVNVVIIPESGYERNPVSNYNHQKPQTTVLRNATGVLR